MKKILLFLIAIIGIVGCTKSTEWVYKEFPNDYQLWKNKNETYQIGKIENNKLMIEKNEVPIGITGNITGFTIYQERYISVLLKDDTKANMYYVIDTKEEQLYGPLNEEEYDYKLTALGIMERDDFTLTNPAPEIVEYK